MHCIKSPNISKIIIERTQKQNKTIRILTLDWLNNIINNNNINKNELKYKYKDHISFLSDYISPVSGKYKILIDYICSNIILCDDNNIIKILINSGYSNIWDLNGNQHSV